MWQPISKAHGLGVGAPSAFIEAMTSTFGNPPWTLDGTSVERLSTMAVMSPDACYGALVAAIESMGPVMVWVECSDAQAIQAIVVAVVAFALYVWYVRWYWR